MESSTRSLNDLPRQADAFSISHHRERAFESSRPSSKMRYISNAVLFLRIFAFAAVVPCLLRLKLTRVGGVLESGRKPLPVPEDSVRKITAYVETAIRRGKPLVRGGCLTRGLTRYYFLRRAGMDVSLRFGMGRHDKEFMGHCWLVKDGEPFLEVEDPRPRYLEMYRISRAGAQAFTPTETQGFGSFPNS
jgi:hypothetical protein